jgi:hypothetical protein
MLFFDENHQPLTIGKPVVGELADGSTVRGFVAELDDYYEPPDVNGDGLCYPRVGVLWEHADGELEWNKAYPDYVGYDEWEWVCSDLTVRTAGMVV